MAGETNLVQIIVRAVDQASSALTGIGVNVKKLSADIEKHAASFAVAGAAITTALGLAVKGADEERKGQERLAVALANTGASYRLLQPDIEAQISALQQQTAVADDLQRDALAKLVGVTGDVQLAMAALPAVLDLAALRGTSLSTAVKQLGPVLAGTTDNVTSLGLEFDESVPASERLEAILAKVSGTAASSASPLDKMGSAFGEVGDAVGTALLPLVDALSTTLTTIFNAISELPGPVLTFGSILLATAGGAASLLGTVGLLTKALPFLGVAFQTALGPIGWVSLAIAGIVTAFSLFADEAPEAITPAKNVGAAFADASDDIEGAGDAAKKTTAKLQEIVKPLGETSDAILAATAALDEAVRNALLPTDELASKTLQVLFDLASQGGAYVDEFGNKIGFGVKAFTDALANATPEAKAKLLELGRTAVEELGITAEDVGTAGGNIKQKIVDQFFALKAEAAIGLQDTVTQAGEILALLPPAAAEPLTTMRDQTDALLLETKDKAAAQAEAIVPAVVDPIGTIPPEVAVHLGQLPPAFVQTGTEVISYLQTVWPQVSDLISGPVEAGVGAAIDALNNLANQAITIFNTILDQLANVQNALGAAASGSGSNSGSSSGSSGSAFDGGSNFDSGSNFDTGSNFASGTSYFGGGLARVGEAGAELALLPSGTRVFSNRDSRKLLGGRGGGGVDMRNYGSMQFVLPGIQTGKEALGLANLLLGGV